MTTDRLREIAFDMEEPLGRFACLDSLLVEMIDGASADKGHQTKVYALMQRTLGGNLRELRELWREFFALAVQTGKKPPLTAVKDGEARS